MKLTVVLSLVLLVVLVASLWLNARYPSQTLVGSAQVAAVASLLSGIAAFVAGIRRLVRARPEFRKPVLYLGLITFGVLLMHLYIINSPPTSTGGTLRGTVGTTFHDSQVQVSSTLAGSHLRVSIAVTGSNAVSEVKVSLDNQTLPAALVPLPTYASPIEPTTASTFGFASVSDATWSVQASSLSVLRVEYQYLTCYHVPDANDRRAVYGCIMDESYYVPSSLGLLSGSQCAPYADSCNLEHPPLAKALIAGGMAVFGLNDLGWRLPNLVLGTLSIPLLFVLSYSLTGNRRLSYFATLVFAADTLFFVHSSAALIDVPSVFFSLLGFILYFRRTHFWKVNNYVASGIFFGLAALSKETALFALAAAASYELLFGGVGFRAAAVRIFSTAAPAVLVFAGTVQLYDSALTSSALPWFYQHIGFMLNYGSGLRGGGWSDPGLGRYITPLDWLLAYTPVSYLVTTVTVTVSGAVTSTATYVSVGYYGIANQVIVWMVFTWVPFTLYKLMKNRQLGTPPSADDRFGVLLTVLFLWSYVPYLTLWLYGRVTYPFYILPAMPALAAGSAYFITRDWFPRKMAVVYVIAAFAIFFLYFPVKDFLPEFVRAWLAR